MHLSEHLTITPYHPVLYNGVWTFPCNIGKTIQKWYDAVYSIVLEPHQNIITIDGMCCASYGHSLHTNSVIRQEYFGSNKCIEDLKTQSGWEKGMIEDIQLQRNPKTGLVDGIIPKSITHPHLYLQTPEPSNCSSSCCETRLALSGRRVQMIVPVHACLCLPNRRG